MDLYATNFLTAEQKTAESSMYFSDPSLLRQRFSQIYFGSRCETFAFFSLRQKGIFGLKRTDVQYLAWQRTFCWAVEAKTWPGAAAETGAQGHATAKTAFTVARKPDFIRSEELRLS